jgi:signal transduction histidine kinase
MCKESGENLPHSGQVESSLRERIAAVITDGVINGSRHGTIADAVITEIAAFRLEVSEDEFLDAVIAEDE